MTDPRRKTGFVVGTGLRDGYDAAWHMPTRQVPLWIGAVALLFVSMLGIGLLVMWLQEVRTRAYNARTTLRLEHHGDATLIRRYVRKAGVEQVEVRRGTRSEWEVTTAAAVVHRYDGNQLMEGPTDTVAFYDQDPKLEFDLLDEDWPLVETGVTVAVLPEHLAPTREVTSTSKTITGITSRMGVYPDGSVWSSGEPPSDFQTFTTTLPAQSATWAELPLENPWQPRTDRVVEVTKSVDGLVQMRGVVNAPSP